MESFASHAKVLEGHVWWGVSSGAQRKRWQESVRLRCFGALQKDKKIVVSKLLAD